MARGPRRAPSRKAAPPRRRVPGLSVLLLLVFLILGGGLAWLAFGPGPPPKEGGTETTVILKRGSGLPQIAETLADGGVIRRRSPSGFWPS